MPKERKNTDIIIPEYKQCTLCKQDEAHKNHDICTKCIDSEYEATIGFMPLACGRKGCKVIFAPPDGEIPDDEYWPESYCSALCELRDIQDEYIILDFNQMAFLVLYQSFIHARHHYPCELDKCKIPLEGLKHCTVECINILRNRSTMELRPLIAKDLKKEWKKCNTKPARDMTGTWSWYDYMDLDKLH
ncbi:hypothetical protein LCGC14_0175600 [marine sediment metagenome]|uniref:Uncharacterized protein n=1 Tax=marine sediment metagenome TaxID=412755 RepID=A0A0F9X9M6_9ZZZZ